MLVLLLAVLLVLTKAHHVYVESNNMIYSENDNGTIHFQWSLSDIEISCEGAATCINMPPIQANLQILHIKINECSPVVLRCVDKVVHPLLLVHVNLIELIEPITREDVKKISNVMKLTMFLKRTDTSIPTAAINSLYSLIHLDILGGNMQNLNQNKIKHKYLISLRLGANNISTFPKNFFVGLPSLSNLQIRDNNIENIGAGTFKGLENLKELFLINIGLKSIENGTFSVTPRLSKLVIVDNLLQALPNHLLVNLKSLAVLSIFDTQNTRTEQVNFEFGSHAVSQLPALKLVHLSDLNINNLPENVFDGSNNIRLININNNLINTLPSKIFSKMHSLESLDLTSNIIHEIPNNIFNNLTSLEMLFLADNRIQHLPSDIFTSMTKLSYLSLCINSIEVLPNQIFNSLTSLMGLDLCNNSIMALPEDIFSSLTSLKSLDLSGNNIKRLPDQIFANLITLDNLNLRNNRIEELTMYQFFGLNNLRQLILSNNKISYIPMLALADLSSVLRRENEAILSILETETSVPSYRFVSPFTLLLHLEVLDLSGNHIANLYKGWDYDLRNIKVLNLSRNYFTDTQTYSVDFSSLNITIDMRDNNIANAPQFLPYHQSEPASSTLILNTPINCDCNSYSLFLRASGARLDTEPQYILNDSRCIAPPHLKGKLLKDVSPTDLVCDLSEYCPDINNCSHCIINVASKEVALKCLELPSRLPDLIFSLNFNFPWLGETNLTLTLIHPPNNIENLDIYVYKLNLSNTGMHSINFKPSKSLNILDVSHNNLVTVPDTFFNRNITLYLSGNPLECDCWLTEKLAKYRVADFDLVTCADKRKLAAINVQDLCNRKYALAGYICSGIMCALFLLKCIFTTRKQIKKKINNISRRFLRRGSDYSIELEKRLDNAKQFDLFISFAHEDTEFVKHKLLPKLENEFKQKVCVHYRDWVAGELIADQIVQSVESARRTVIILTENFLASEWAYLEFRTAHNMTIQEGRPRVIMILLKEDMVNSERLTRDIKSYIACNTYLLWEDPEFWPKLKNVLPRKGQ